MKTEKRVSFYNTKAKSILCVQYRYNTTQSQGSKFNKWFVNYFFQRLRKMRERSGIGFTKSSNKTISMHVLLGLTRHMTTRKTFFVFLHLIIWKMNAMYFGHPVLWQPGNTFFQFADMKKSLIKSKFRWKILSPAVETKIKLYLSTTGLNKDTLSVLACSQDQIKILGMPHQPW